MRNITVEKAKLVETLETNLALHMGKYDVAMERYKEAMGEWFNRNLDLLVTGKFHLVQRVCPHPVPEKHDDDYQRALDMLAWDLGDTYELSETDFDQYINDQWGWGRTFAMNTASYLVEQA